MNYLAHAYLSFHRQGILVGNMISDFIKGRKQFDYPAEVQKGIRLHRAIDTFTDDSAVTKEAKQVFRPYVGLYAGAFMDVVYDHFLAKDETQFPGGGLAAFAQETYTVLNAYTGLLPERFIMMLPYMVRQNWLLNYATVGGIEKSFGGVVRRAAYLTGSDDVFKAFLDNYDSLQQYYNAFFPELKNFVEDEINKPPLCAGVILG